MARVVVLIAAALALAASGAAASAAEAPLWSPALRRFLTRDEEAASDRLFRRADALDAEDFLGIAPQIRGDLAERRGNGRDLAAERSESVRRKRDLADLLKDLAGIAGDLKDLKDLAGIAGDLKDLQDLEDLKDRAQAAPADTPWLKTCAGFIAQEMCSTVFGSGLSEATAWEEDLGRLGEIGGTYTIDYAERSVVGMCRINNPENTTYKSIFRDGIGCTLVEVLSEEEIRAQRLGDVLPRPPLDPAVPWPLGEGFFPEDAPPGVDLACLARVAEDQFANEAANARGLVVVYKGQLVFEEYAQGITKANRLLGWSATKSVTQSLVGVLAGEGRISVTAPARVSEWYETPGDARQNSTVDMMLRMSSGTVWTGDIGPTTQCIFWSDNACAHVCALKPLEADPDTLWNYNSGSSYILSRMIMELRGEPELTNYEWPRVKLFNRIGAHSFYIEYQPNGYFLGGAYGYATARDWARFGLLYQRDGVWVDGTRILPEGWVQYSGTPSSTNSGYAAHFWKSPSVDPNLFYASGFRNENVFIFPDQELVVVRFAMPPMLALGWNSNAFLTSMLSCLAK